ncbi:MAG: DUF6951 family protein [Anaerolineae bacterium]
MSEVMVQAGVCGFTTRVIAVATADGMVALTIDSDCPSVRRLAQALPQVDSLREISYRGQPPEVLEAAATALPHPACVVPSAILKAVEVAAGLALATDVHVSFVRPND